MLNIRIIMKAVLISLWVILFAESNAHPTVSALPYPPPLDSSLQSGPTQLIATSSGDFIAILDRFLLFIHHNSSDVKVLLRLDHGQVGVAASDISAILICFGDGGCSYIADILEQNSSNIDIYKVENVATSSVPISMSVVYDTYYIASSAHTQSGTIRISQYNIAAKYFLQSKGNFQERITNNEFISREFHYNFDDGFYVYFIAMDTSSAYNRKIKLLRVCHEENATATNGLSSMFEIELYCGLLNANARIVSFSQLHEVVILGLSGAAANFCAFTTTAVNAAITRAYNHCYENTTHKFQRPWSSTPYSCMQFGEVS